MKVFIDANIILDVFSKDRRYHKYSLDTYTFLLQQQYQLFTSCDLITTIYYIDSKKDKKQALINIKSINKTLRIIDFSNQEVEQTCELMLKDNDYKDLEDTLQYIMAKKENCDIIISNDEKFISKDIKILTSKEFYKRYIKDQKV